MSAFGTKRTSELAQLMSAFGGKADIGQPHRPRFMSTRPSLPPPDPWPVPPKLFHVVMAQGLRELSRIDHSFPHPPNRDLAFSPLGLPSGIARLPLLERHCVALLCQRQWASSKLGLPTGE